MRKARIRLVRTWLVAGAIVLASAAGARADTQGVESHAAEQRPGAVIDFWTPKRMRNAEELGPPVSAPGPLGSPSIDPGAPPVVIPGSRPGGDTYAVNTDSDTSPAADTTFPQRIHGKVFFSAGGSIFACSGTVVHSPLANLVVTAGHCVFGANGVPAYVTNFAFVPGYRNGASPLGVWPATQLFAPSGWTSGPSFSFDIGMARLAAVNGALIENALGARGIAFNLPATQTFDIYGYPARPNLTQDGFPLAGGYNGQDLILCDDNTTQITENTGTPPSIGAAECWMQQGASGGGWVIPSIGAVNSVVSHGYCHTRALFPAPPTPMQIWPASAPNTICGIFFGPYFGTDAQNLYTSATTDPATKKCKKKKKKGKKKRKKKKCKKKKKKK